MPAISVGDVFNYPGTESEGSTASYYRNKGGWHIHIVVGIDESRGDAYLVPLSSVSYDRTCEIKVNDRCPSVTKPCAVAYFHGKKIPLDRLQKIGVLSGRAPKELLARVIAALAPHPAPNNGSRRAFARPSQEGEDTPRLMMIMATMTPGRWINLVAVALGALGAFVLYKGSFAFEGFGQWHNRASIEAQTARNLQRQKMQRLGLGLIFASFAVQGLAPFFD